MALYVQQRLRLQRLHMMPCGQPVHRQAPAASAAERFNMLQLALLAFPALYPDRTEIDRPGPSYTIDTLKYFRQRWTDRRVCLVIGFDAFCAFTGWHAWQSIPDYAHIIVLRRQHQTNIDVSEFPSALQQVLNQRRVDDSMRGAELASTEQGKVLFLQNPTYFESSSAIRADIKAGRSIRQRVPLAVADFIESRQLYR